MKIRCKYDAMIAVGDLKPHPKNRNKHPEDQIDRLSLMLKYQGVRAPIVVSNQSGFIVKGHGTLLSIVKAGGETAPVVYQDFENSDQEYSFVQGDNAIANWAELDLSGINTDIKDLGPDFDKDMLGIKGFEIDVADKDIDGDSVPGRQKKVRTKKGDLWILGPHRLLCGDATMVDDVGKLMGEDRADCVWTDPPYNVAYEGATKDKLSIMNDDMDDEKFYEFLYQAFANMILVTKPGGAIYIAHADTEGLNFRKAMKNAGWLMKQCLIWEKQQFVMGRQDYHWKHEPILYGWAPGAAHQWHGDRKQSTILLFDRPKRSEEHPTMKPVALIEYCLGNSAPRGGLVIDLFGGSGSTMVACEKTNRIARLMELDPGYVDVICRRWLEITAEEPLLLNEDGSHTKWSEVQEQL